MTKKERLVGIGRGGIENLGVAAQYQLYLFHQVKSTQSLWRTQGSLCSRCGCELPIGPAGFDHRYNLAWCEDCAVVVDQQRILTHMRAIINSTRSGQAFISPEDQR